MPPSREGETGDLQQRAFNANMENVLAQYALGQHMRRNYPRPPYGSMGVVVGSLVAGGYLMWDGFKNTHAVPFINISNGVQPREIAAGAVIALGGAAIGAVVAGRRMRG